MTSPRRCSRSTSWCRSRATAPSTSTSGCEAADFDGFTGRQRRADPARHVRLRGEGRTTPRTPGASAVIIFNEGQPGRDRPARRHARRRRPRHPGASGSATPTAPSSSQSARAQATTVHAFAVDAETRSRADQERHRRHQDRATPDQTLVVGSHLDSVVEGPGINDNGSGTSTDPRDRRGSWPSTRSSRANSVRFAFWGAEESGLLGSTHYVDEPEPDARSASSCANLNFDMLGSPNYVRFVYDGDGSTRRRRPAGSAQIEDAVQRLLRLAGPRRPSRPRSTAAPTTARSSTSASRPAACSAAPRATRPPEEAAVYGGTAGEPYDSVLPPGVRRHQQPEHEGAVRARRRRGARRADPREDEDRASSRTAASTAKARKKRRQGVHVQRRRTPRS